MVMPFTTVQKRITGTFWLDEIFCSAVSREAMTDATTQITGLLRERHHLTAAEDDDFNVRRPEDLIQAQLATSRIMTILLASVASGSQFRSLLVVPRTASRFSTEPLPA